MPAKHDEGFDFECKTRRHDPANATDNKIGITDKRQQLPYRQLAAEEILMRWRTFPNEPFLFRLEIGYRDNMVSVHQCCGNFGNIFRPWIARFVAPFATYCHRPNDG